ncbi:MAG TPA: CaiB/BaiF CoA-transferase family protein [Dehalococcoidales bacterium]|nr:CaiB/BaiF CoA-transferase family protein [Dehalococcoidales bacterium]
MTEKQILPAWRVIDITDEKGWFCGKLLADMGAVVIRVDPPGQPLPSSYFHTGKHSLTLACDRPQGRELFNKLISNCEILIESFRPDYLPSLGLSYSDLKDLNPGLVMASITPFGQSGPSALRESSGLTASAAGGQLFLNGEPERPPLQPYGQQAYLTASLFAANGILLAMRRSKASQRGQHIDISIQECTAGTLDHALVRYFSLGEIARRQGTEYWNEAFRVFPCRNGFVLLSIWQNWDILVEWMASENMAGDLQDARWQNPEERRRHTAPIVEQVRRWTLSHTAAELVETAQLMHLPWMQVNSPQDILTNPHLKERGYWVETGDPYRPYLFPGAPLKMSESPWGINPELPRSGDYNREIYRNCLGLSHSEIDRLADEGII